jgi:MFS family permease
LFFKPFQAHGARLVSVIVSRVDELNALNARKPLWPVASLCLLTGLNLFDYLDRKLLDGVLPLLRKDLGLTYEQGGRLTTAFMLGYFLTSPIFGYLGDRVPRRWLVAAGVFVWSLGTLFSGHANLFGTLLCFRVMVGLGEASFGTISPGWIADLFPALKRNNAITVFYLAIPVGAALGYLIGGYIGVHYGWRTAFYFAGYPGLLFAATMFLLREPPRGASETKPVDDAQATLGWRAYLELRKFPVYVLVVLGYTAQTFAMGGFSTWAPTFFHESHQMPLDKADFFFGSSLAVTGLLATLGGGFLATRWQRRTGTGYAWVLALSAIAAVPFAYGAFAVAEAGLSKALMVVAMFLLFLSTGPVNTLIVETVPVRMRATSMAASIFMIHMFGDLWSPQILGAMADRFGGLREPCLWALPGALAVSAIFWCALVAYVRRRAVAA